MKSDSDGSTDHSSTPIGWEDGFLGMLVGSGAGLCCTGPAVFGVLGLAGVAGILTAMPFVYHLILQWLALVLIGGVWCRFLYKWFHLPEERRWSRVPIISGGILVVMCLYVIRSWATHVLI